MNGLVVVLCTVGRSEILINSINSIVLDNTQNYEILVVDNNREGLSTDVLERIKTINNISLVHEPNLGLSIARNSGVESFNKKWILFLDDDIQVPKGFFNKLDIIIQSQQFDCFGGMYYPWYPYEKPIWLPAKFGQKTLLRKDTGVIDVHKDGFLSAGILCVKREALQSVGGFRTDVGMGKGIGYGEEDDLQIRLQAAGYKLGFVPDWWLYHAVLPHKHKVSWHLKSAYARGRDGQKVHNKWKKSNAVFFLVKGLGGLILRGVSCLIRLFSRRDYYWQNAVIDIFGPFLNICGRFMTVFVP